MGNDLGTILGVLLGVGGTGGLGAIFALWRSHKKGKIEDEGTMIERLDKDNQSQHEQRKRAEDERDKAQATANMWMQQAIMYRLQMVAHSPPIVPNDIPELWHGPVKPNEH